MADRTRQNKQVIESAFARFAQSEERIIREGMENALTMGVEMALANHDGRHQMHLKMGDSYGWALFHDGVLVSKRIWNENGGADFSSMLTSYSGESGWFGVVMSDMKPAYYFAVRYEFWVLRKTIKDLKDKGFSQYFVKA